MHLMMITTVAKPRVSRGDHVLNQERIIAFVPVTDIDRAMHFYADVLGLIVTDCSDDFCALDAGERACASPASLTTQRCFRTVVGWSVDNLDATVGRLAHRAWIPSLRRDESEREWGVGFAGRRSGRVVQRPGRKHVVHHPVRQRAGYVDGLT